MNQSDDILLRLQMKKYWWDRY